ncbi:MAG: MBG domain-containing protein, partial [Verrucomicrobiota bacterium]
VGTINDANYQGSANGSLVVSKASATVTLSSLAATYNGSAKAATATTTPTGLTVTFTYAGSATAPTNAGTYAVVGTINDANYQGSANGSLVISRPPPTFGTWATDLETSSGLAAGTVANHPDADFDHDGRSNLVEYAFGTSPVTANDPAPRMPQAQISLTHFVMQYQRDTTLTDLTFTAEACSGLGNWKAPGDAGAPAGFTDSVISTSSGVETHQVIIPRSSGTNIFMRMRISRP